MIFAASPLAASIGILIGLIGLAVGAIALQRRANEARTDTPWDEAERRGRNREVWLAWDGAVDSIDRLLAQDKTRLFLTEDEQIELRAHVRRFENMNNRKGRK